MPGDAALAALEADFPAEHALSVLEIGQNLVNNTTIGYRIEINISISEDYPEILRDFNQLRMETNALSCDLSISPNVRQKRLQKTRTAMEVLHEQIRCIPGYKDVLGPQSSED